MNNETRCNRFEVVILSLTDDYDNDVPTALIDLMTDAMHWCRQYDQDFDRCLRLVSKHFDAETQDSESEA
jgi:hypothetical protein